MPEQNSAHESRPFGTILIAEDDEADVFFLQRALQQLQVLNPVRVVNDGRQLLKYLKGEEPFHDRAIHPYPSILFLDIHLPGKSGLEVLSWLKEHTPPALLRVIAWSGTCGPHLEQALRLGAHHCLEKHFDPETYTRALRHLPGLRLEPSAGGFYLI